MKKRNAIELTIRFRIGANIQEQATIIREKRKGEEIAFVFFFFLIIYSLCAKKIQQFKCHYYHNITQSHQQNRSWKETKTAAETAKKSISALIV